MELQTATVKFLGVNEETKCFSLRNQSLNRFKMESSPIQSSPTTLFVPSSADAIVSRLTGGNEKSALSVTVPSGRDLNNVEETIYEYDVSVAAKLGISFAMVNTEVSNEYTKRIYIHELRKSKTIPAGTGHLQLTYGLAVRIYVSVTVNNSNAKVSSLPLIAASVQLGYASAESSIGIVGVKADSIKLPNLPGLTLEEFSKWSATFVELKNILASVDVALIDPVVLAVSTTPDYFASPAELSNEEIEIGMITAVALQHINKRKSLAHTLQSKITYRGKPTTVGAIPHLRDRVTKVYNALGSVTEVAMVTAKQHLMGKSIFF